MLNEIREILEEEFLWNGRYLEEKKTNMSIKIDKRGCKYLAYSFDKDLKGYKGGLFPYFKRVAKLSSICDYIIFAEDNTDKKLFVLLIELKKSSANTLPQLKAGKIFAQFLINTVNRVNQLSYNPKFRLISIIDSRLHKNLTKEKGVRYINDHFSTSANSFLIREFLV